VKIGIIGLGFVGLSLAAVLGAKNFSVLGVDNDNQKIIKLKNSETPFYEPELQKFLHLAQKKSLVVTLDLEQAVKNSDFLFVTVSTPSLASGEINLKFIKNVVIDIGKKLRKTDNKPIIVIKSTVIPTSSETVLLPLLEKFSRKSNGKGFGFLTNPEFLREGRAIDDTLNPHIIVIGGTVSNDITKLKKFYSKLYKKNIPTITTNHSNAELIKYANNSFLATKISFINQLANICQKIPHSNIDEIANAIGLDPRIGSQFLNAGPGFGGSCLPKDLNALIQFSSKIGYKNSFLNAVQQTNIEQAKRILSLIESTLGNLKNKKITILGVAFKENSDDIRESVSVKLIHLLLQKNVKIITHDPKALSNLRKIFKKRITYSNTVSESLISSNCAVIMTSWDQYRNLKNSSFNQMKQKNLIDTRRLLSHKKLKLNYIAVGIGA
tara:strand:+ start:43720 stop:45033 length:1314 start_codon:yes stop_codon:yes gene_type:complete